MYKRQRNYLLFFLATNKGAQMAGYLTKLTTKDLLDPNDLNNNLLSEVCKSIGEELGLTNVMLTNIIYRGIVEPVPVKTPQQDERDFEDYQNSDDR